MSNLRLNYKISAVLVLVVVLSLAIIYSYSQSNKSFSLDENNVIKPQQTVIEEVDSVSSQSQLVDDGYYYVGGVAGLGRAPGHENDDGIIYSPFDEEVAVPIEVWRVINGADLPLNYQTSGVQYITAFDMPIDPQNDDVIYLSTAEPLSEDHTIFISRIYSYNLSNHQLSLINSVTTQSEVGVVNGDGLIYRTVGIDGSKIVIMKDTYDNSPGICTKIWADYKDNMKYLDLNNIESGLLPYNVPESKVRQSEIEAQNCLNSL